MRSALSSLTQAVKRSARAAGFDLVGVAPATPPPHVAAFRDWLAAGRHGEMAYLERRADERSDPRRVLPGAQSIVVVGFLYAPPDGAIEAAEAGGGAGASDASEAAAHVRARGRIARYAAGSDYHDVLGKALRRVGESLPRLAGHPVRWRAYVDTGPVLEKAVAAAAGLGWIGKNTCLIEPRLGSYLFLGVVLTDLALEVDGAEADHCGTCRACLDACPTDAFPEPYVLDATRCLAYTTIELRGPIPEPLRAPQGDWVFGCDICQEVCPWNRRSRRAHPPDPSGLRSQLAPRRGSRGPSLRDLLELDEDGWRRETRGSALRRAKYRGLLRNALVAAGNSGDPALLPAVARHAESNDELIADHARWALRRLREGGAAASPASRSG